MEVYDMPRFIVPSFRLKRQIQKAGLPSLVNHLNGPVELACFIKLANGSTPSCPKSLGCRHKLFAAARSPAAASASPGRMALRRPELP
jgi:hypothetical protein